MSEETDVTEAIDTVARNVVWKKYTTRYEVDWEDYPEIGEHDWTAVLNRADEIVKSIEHSTEAFKAAYALLEARAEGSQA